MTGYRGNPFDNALHTHSHNEALQMWWLVVLGLGFGEVGEVPRASLPRAAPTTPAPAAVQQSGLAVHHPQQLFKGHSAKVRGVPRC